MANNKNAQRAGAESVLIQAGTINLGITEERAWEIANTAAKSLIENHSRESWATLEARLSQFSRIVVAELQAVDGLKELAEPAFQRTMLRAQQSAAMTDLEEDHEMLAELVALRATDNAPRIQRSAMDKAIEVVGELDASALRAMTVTHAFGVMLPNLESGFSRTYLDEVETAFSKVIEGGLPDGIGWVEHLEILGLARANPAATYHDPRKYFSVNYGAWLVRGTAGKPDLKQITGMNFPEFEHRVVSQGLLPGRYRLATQPAWEDAERLLTFLTDGNVDAMTGIRDAFGYGTVDNEALDALLAQIELRESWARVLAWHSDQSRAVELNMAGQYLVDSNIRRLGVEGIIKPKSMMN